MPNRNYQKGRRLEWEARDYFEDLGYYVHRCAGSKSPFDLICFAIGRMTLGVQCKATVPTTLEVGDAALAATARGILPCMVWKEDRATRYVIASPADLERRVREVRDDLRQLRKEKRCR